jgi:hypothetical protein
MLDRIIVGNEFISSDILSRLVSFLSGQSSSTPTPELLMSILKLFYFLSEFPNLEIINHIVETMSLADVNLCAVVDQLFEILQKQSDWLVVIASLMILSRLIKDSRVRHFVDTREFLEILKSLLTSGESYQYDMFALIGDCMTVYIAISSQDSSYRDLLMQSEIIPFLFTLTDVPLRLLSSILYQLTSQCCQNKDEILLEYLVESGVLSSLASPQGHHRYPGVTDVLKACVEINPMLAEVITLDTVVRTEDLSLKLLDY